MIPGYEFSLDFIGVDDPWIGVDPDMGALRQIVCETFQISDSDCGAAIRVGVVKDAGYVCVYSFLLPDSRRVIARLVAPVKPLFKTEGEVAAMDFVRSECHNSTYRILNLRSFQTVRTSLPVPKVFAYSFRSEPSMS
jgi:hypothetical protein